MNWSLYFHSSSPISWPQRHSGSLVFYYLNYKIYVTILAHQAITFNSLSIALKDTINTACLIQLAWWERVSYKHNNSISDRIMGTSFTDKELQSYFELNGITDRPWSFGGLDINTVFVVYLKQKWFNYFNYWNFWTMTVKQITQPNFFPG